MGIGISLFFLAVGAILNYAINIDDPSGVDLNTIGVILMIVGIIGLVLSMIFWSSWGGFNRRSTYVEGAPVRRAVVPPRRRTVVEEDDVVEPGPPPPPP